MDGVARTWLEDFFRRALLEDVGGYGDLTSEALFDPATRGVGRFEAREDGVVAGLEALPVLAPLVDPGITLELEVGDGDAVGPMQVLARARGPIRSLLTMERLALNTLGRMSGIASLTRRFVDAAGGKIDILDTRKTTPLHRPLDKYAVRCGGGTNHRYGLFDAAMIKDNHRDLAGVDLGEAIARVRARLGHTQVLVCEVESHEGARQAAEAGADVILLDNMTPEQLTAIAGELRDRVRLEASGGIRLDTLPAIAQTGVHAASAGALTHSARWLDVAFELETE